MELTDEIHLTRISQIGDELLEFKNNALPILKKYILDPMYQDAFKAFSLVDPSDQMQVIQTQMIYKVTEKIERLIDQKIEEGRLAKQTLITLPLQDE